ncbi:bifunctional diaminohydroxyphosphoribosylaminopyrimidine deaminase/5-amino-6-(5-phosphoribosylamino)uracil reductase RibD [Spirochaeta dissipatitropha]
MDTMFMEQALRLAENGRGHVSPNPLVGAVIVRDGEIIGSGYHAEYGGPHAEANAIENTLANGHSLEGAVLYCSLEPCSFCSPHKHNPPCTRSIIEQGFSRVVIAIADPNPLVSGNGITALRDAGIETIVGVLAEEALNQNEAYILSMRLQRPYLHLKWAQTLDGFISTESGDSKWISSREAREEVHRIRKSCDAVLIGSGTAEADNPQLTIRLGGAASRASAGLHELHTDNENVKQPLRVILDSNADLRIDSRLVKDAHRIPTRVYCSTDADETRCRNLEKNVVTVRRIETDSSTGLSLEKIMDDLYADGIHSILVEGGALIHSAFLSAGLYDRLTVFTEPILLGSGRRPSSGIPAARTIASALRMTDQHYQAYGTTMSVSSLNPESAAHLRKILINTASSGGEKCEALMEAACSQA